MKDCYGHFLILYIFTKIEKITIFEIFEIITKIGENILDFCKFEYSSSVIEKCFEKGNKRTYY